MRKVGHLHICILHFYFSPFSEISFTFAWAPDEVRISGHDLHRGGGNDEERSSWKNRRRKGPINYYQFTVHAKIHLVDKQYTQVSKVAFPAFTHIRAIYHYYRFCVLDIRWTVNCPITFLIFASYSAWLTLLHVRLWALAHERGTEIPKSFPVCPSRRLHVWRPFDGEIYCQEGSWKGYLDITYTRGDTSPREVMQKPADSAR